MPSVGRFMYWPPWRLTEPWRYNKFPGGDEWGNESTAVVVPALGCFIWFHKPFDRSLPMPNAECQAPRTHKPEDCICESAAACRRVWFDEGD